MGTRPHPQRHGARRRLAAPCAGRGAGAVDTLRRPRRGAVDS